MEQKQKAGWSLRLAFCLQFLGRGCAPCARSWESAPGRWSPEAGRQSCKLGQSRCSHAGNRGPGSGEQQALRVLYLRSVLEVRQREERGGGRASSSSSSQNLFHTPRRSQESP